MDHSGEGLQLISDSIRNTLNIDVSVLMGANLAGEVAEGNFCETTIGNYFASLFFLLLLYIKNSTYGVFRSNLMFYLYQT